MTAVIDLTSLITHEPEARPVSGDCYIMKWHKVLNSLEKFLITHYTWLFLFFSPNSSPVNFAKTHLAMTKKKANKSVLYSVVSDSLLSYGM